MLVDIQKLNVYKECPAKYKFRYIDKIEPEYVDAIEWAEHVTKTLFARYIYKQMGDVTTQLKTMKSQFNDIWESSEYPIGPGRLADEMKRFALGSVVNFWCCFYNFFSIGKNPLILPNLPFNINSVEWSMPHNNNVISGHIDAVYITQLGHNIVKWIYYPPHSGDFDTEYELLLYAYAYKRKTGIKPLDLLVFYLYDSTSISISESDSFRCLKFYDYTIEALKDSIKIKRFYPRTGLHCRRCPFQKHCMKEHGINFDGGLKHGRKERYPTFSGSKGKVPRLSAVSELRRAFSF